MATTIRFTLFSAKEIEKAKQQLIEYQENLNEKLDLFVQKLCEKGVEIAKEKVSVHDAIDTGELLNSIDLREGDKTKILNYEMEFDTKSQAEEAISELIS